MAVNIFDQNSLMRIGTRQLSVRGPRKSGKPTMVIKRISRPSHTAQWLTHAIHFAEEGASTRGRTFEEVIAHMAANAGESEGFKQQTRAVQEAKKRGKYAMADNNISAMKQQLAGSRGYGGTGASAPRYARMPQEY